MTTSPADNNVISEEKQSFKRRNKLFHNLFSTNSFLFNFFPSWPAANLKLFLLLLKVGFKEYSRRKVQNKTKKTFIIIIYIVSETNTSN